jgi:predicted acylesterase/phospholipase RssA
VEGDLAENLARRRLLAIDGGGLRGIIPACVLVELERATGTLARDSFDFIAGTSTGAIVAAGVVAGIPAQQLLDLYLERAASLFTQRPWTIPKRIITGAMYSTPNLHALLARELGPAASRTLNDVARDLLITAKRLSDGLPWYFTKDTPRNKQRTGRLQLADCVTASCAEATYFRPYLMPEHPSPASDPVGTLVGGGVGVANNPVYQACVEAFDYSEGYTPGGTIVVSLGTGRAPALPRPTWIWPWLHWVLDELLDSPGEQQTDLVQRNFPGMPFYRIDVQLPREVPLDDLKSLPALRHYGQQLARQVSWPPILAGQEDSPFRINIDNTLPQQYARRVNPPA